MHATALRSLGDLADDRGMCEKALEHLQSYLRISRKLDEFETECKAYLRLGEVGHCTLYISNVELMNISFSLSD